MKEIELAKIMHDICEKNYPMLYASITNLVSQGQTPKQIETEMARRVPQLQQAQTTKDVLFYTAKYLALHQAANQLLTRAD